MTIEEGEVCQRCDKEVGVVWHAPNKLWRKVTGFREGGILCVRCFDDLVWERLGTFVYWSCSIRLYPKHAIFHRLRHWLRSVSCERWLKKRKIKRKR